jgi:hypothetical protein
MGRDRVGSVKASLRRQRAAGLARAGAGPLALRAVRRGCSAQAGKQP